jgi:hypothetical protein
MDLSLRVIITGVAVIIIGFCSCKSTQVSAHNSNAGADTIMYSTYINADNLVSGTSILLGPFLIKLGPLDNNTLRQNSAFSIKRESSDVFQFIICCKNICAVAESAFYEKRKTTLLGGKNEGVMRVKGEKIYGKISTHDKAAMNFEVNRLGRLRGHGFFRISEDEMIRIEPHTKKMNYGKKAYAVGLDFTLDNKTIGGFIQNKKTITVFVNRQVNENIQLLITALSLALINRSNEIIIL